MCNYADALPAQREQPAQRRRRQRHLAAVRRDRPADRARTTRAVPRLGAGERRADGTGEEASQLPARQPAAEHRLAPAAPTPSRTRASARRATSATSRSGARSSSTPRASGHPAPRHARELVGTGRRADGPLPPHRGASTPPTACRQGPHGIEHGQGRPDRRDGRGDRRLLRLRQGHPVHRGLPPEGGVRDVQPDPAELAGADRRRQRRQGQVDRAPGGHRARRSSSWRSRTRACRSTRTPRSKIRPRIFLEGNFFVDLKPGHPVRADARRRRHAADHPDGDPGAVRPDPATRCSRTRARACATRCRAWATAWCASRRPPTIATATRITRGESAAESLNDAIDYGEEALRSTALVATRSLGVRARRRVAPCCAA